MERDGGDGKWGKINQGETVAEVMSRRTCANRSGSLAGWLAEAESNRGRTTAPYLNPFLLYFSFASLSFLYYFPSLPPIWSSSSPHYLDVTPPLPTHALILNPLDNLRLVLFFSLSLSPLPHFTSHNFPSCLQKAAHHQGLCAAPFPSRGPLARSSSLPVENVQIIGSVSLFP